MSDENNEGIVMPKTVSDTPTEEVKQPEVIAESSPASEENHEEKTNGVQKRINDLTAKRYQAERERDELKRKLEEKALTPIEQAPAQAVDAPQLPDDIYDEEAMKKYLADSQSYNAKVAQDAAKAQLEEQQKLSAQQKIEAQQQKATESYVNNAIRDGVDLDKLKTVEQTLVQGGIKPELGQYIMSDANGAKIAEYLADNQAEMYDILAMDPVSAGIKIATEIKPKVLSQTPKVSGAPDPIPEVKGGGYVEVDDFAKKYPGAEII